MNQFSLDAEEVVAASWVRSTSVISLDCDSPESCCRQSRSAAGIPSPADSSASEGPSARQHRAAMSRARAWKLAPRSFARVYRRARGPAGSVVDRCHLELRDEPRRPRSDVARCLVRGDPIRRSNRLRDWRGDPGRPARRHPPPVVRVAPLDHPNALAVADQDLSGLDLPAPAADSVCRVGHIYFSGVASVLRRPQCPISLAKRG